MRYLRCKSAQFALILTVVLPAGAQRLSFGLKAGGWVTGALAPDVSYGISSEAQRYTAGPAVEVRPTRWFGLELDALYKRAGYRSSNCQFTYCWFTLARGNAFEFPVLAKFRFRRSGLRPFVAGGPSFRYIGRQSAATLSWRTGPIVSGEQVDYTVRRSEFSGDSDRGIGVAGAGGLEGRAGRLQISGEGRYTRWSARYWEEYGSRGYFVGGNRNQSEFLLGIGF
jgi:hypothetical protein